MKIEVDICNRGVILFYFNKRWNLNVFFKIEIFNYMKDIDCIENIYII